MATWRAKCWLGSSSGYQELEVKANTINGAYDQFERVYGAEQIINCRQVSGSGSSSGDYDSTATLWILGILFVVGFIITYWYIVIPIAALVGVFFWKKMKQED